MPQPTSEPSIVGGLAMHLRQAAIIVSIWIGCSSLAACGLAADLPACADRYGKLMVDHWMTVSSLQQLERLLYYRGELTTQTPLAVRYREQKDAVAKTGGRLIGAYRLYASLFKSQSK